MLKPLLLTFCLLAAAAAHADDDGDGDWHLRLKKEIDGWTASLHVGDSEYGSPGHRVRGSGHLVDKDRAVAPFSQLRVDGPVDVRLTQGASESVRVSADDNIEPLIETQAEGDTLVLRLQRGAGFSTRHNPVVWIQCKNLQSLQMVGSGDVRIERYQGDTLSVSMSGSGDLAAGLLELKALNVGISGSGDVKAAGHVEQQSWDLSGSGDVDARSLSGHTAKAHLSGSGDLELGVLESVDAKLSGSGDLSYAGRPQLTQRVTGSGEISSR